MNPLSMRRLVLVASSAVAVMALSACVMVPTPYHGGPGASHGYVTVAPPSAPYEASVGQPMPGYFWIGGYWAWSGHRHTWVPGRWERHRPGRQWVPHNWHRDGRGWREAPGHWR